MREDCGAANGVAAAFDRMPAHQVHPAAQPFLQVFFDLAHFKKPGIASRQEFDQQIHIAASMRRPVRHGTK